MVLMVNFASALSRAEASMAPETSPSQSEWVVIENVFPAFIASCMVSAKCESASPRFSCILL